MGSRMAKNLIKHNVELTVYNRSKAVVEELVSLGAKTAPSAAEAVKEADIVFTMLSKPEVVQLVANGENGFLPHMKSNSIWVDSSTVNPSFSQSAKQWAVQNKLRFLDAPVAGKAPTPVSLSRRNSELSITDEEANRLKDFLEVKALVVEVLEEQLSEILMCHQKLQLVVILVVE